MRELDESRGGPSDAVAPLPPGPRVPGCSIRNIALRRLDRKGEPDLISHQVRHRRVIGGGQYLPDCRNPVPSLAAPRTAIDVRANLGSLPLNKCACAESCYLTCFWVAHLDQSRVVSKPPAGSTPGNSSHGSPDPPGLSYTGRVMRCLTRSQPPGHR